MMPLVANVGPEETFEQIRAEFITDLQRAAAMHSFAWVGARRFRDEVLDAHAHTARDPGTPEPTLWFGNGEPNERFAPYARVKLSEIPTVFADNSPTMGLLGLQWLVFVYALWEDNIRGRIAAAAGCQKTDVKWTLLGDLGLLRNDVIHHRAIATARNSGRCKCLRWFAIGDRIRIDGEHVEEFHRRLDGPDGVVQFSAS